jgi:hypothetical protein
MSTIPKDLPFLLAGLDTINPCEWIIILLLLLFVVVVVAVAAVVL